MALHAWGIDIGDGALKAVRVRERNGRFEIVKAVEIPYFDPFFVDKKNTVPINRRATAALIQFSNTITIPDGDRVAIGYPSFKTFEGFLRPPKVDEAELKRIVSFEVGEMMSVPLKKLDIQFRLREGRSLDSHRIQTLVTDSREKGHFLRQIGEIGLSWDRIESWESAMIPLLRLSYPASDHMLVMSPGLTATTLLVIKRADFWGMTLPVGLTLPPGECADMARDKMTALAARLDGEINDFAQALPVGKGFRPAKILVSGEGARVPSLLNALDARTRQPVEVLRPGPDIVIDSGKHNLPPADRVASMGKAIGLALGSFSAEPVSIPLAEPVRTRRFMKTIPALTGVSFLLLLTAAGFRGLEWKRTQELEQIDVDLENTIPRKLMQETDIAQREITQLRKKLEYMEESTWESLVARIPARLFDRFESKSARNTYGDYQLVELSIDRDEKDGPVRKRALSAVVATRLTDEQTVSKELKATFRAFLKSPTITISGPHPSGEVTPPANMSPLVHYRLSGTLKKTR
jgi:Tfp pilus assembly PilM family ATPase